MTPAPVAGRRRKSFPILFAHRQSAARLGGGTAVRLGRRWQPRFSYARREVSDEQHRVVSPHVYLAKDDEGKRIWLTFDGVSATRGVGQRLVCAASRGRLLSIP